MDKEGGGTGLLGCLSGPCPLRGLYTCPYRAGVGFSEAPRDEVYCGAGSFYPAARPGVWFGGCRAERCGLAGEGRLNSGCSLCLLQGNSGEARRENRRAETSNHRPTQGRGAPAERLWQALQMGNRTPALGALKCTGKGRHTVFKASQVLNTLPAPIPHTALQSDACLLWKIVKYRKVKRRRNRHP